MIPALLAIAPSAGVLFLFWFAIKSIIQADHQERLAFERADAEQARTAAARAAEVSRAESPVVREEPTGAADDGFVTGGTSGPTESDQ